MTSVCTGLFCITPVYFGLDWFSYWDVDVQGLLTFRLANQLKIACIASLRLANGQIVNLLLFASFFFLTYFCVNPYVQLKTNLFAFMGFSKLKPQCLKSFKNFYIDLFTKNFSTHRIIQATFQ